MDRQFTLHRFDALDEAGGQFVKHPREREVGLGGAAVVDKTCVKPVAPGVTIDWYEVLAELP